MKKPINPEKEVWKPVDGYPNYFVSTHGRVKSKVINKPERILHLFSYCKGYFNVGLSCGCLRKKAKVHRLVATAFIENPKNYPHVNHIDNNGKNNHVSNLEWCTHKQNMEHMQKQGRSGMLGRTGYLNVKSKAVLQFTHDKKLVNEYGGLREASRLTGIALSGIVACCKGKRKSSGGFIWIHKTPNLNIAI